jgi:hypothetical protein
MNIYSFLLSVLFPSHGFTFSSSENRTKGAIYSLRYCPRSNNWDIPGDRKTPLDTFMKACPNNFVLQLWNDNWSLRKKTICLVWRFLVPKRRCWKMKGENPPMQVKPRYVASICVLKKLIYSLIYEIPNANMLPIAILFVVIGRFLQF